MPILTNTNSLTQTRPRDNYKDDYWSIPQTVRTFFILDNNVRMDIKCRFFCVNSQFSIFTIKLCYKRT